MSAYIETNALMDSSLEKRSLGRRIIHVKQRLEENSEFKSGNHHELEKKLSRTPSQLEKGREYKGMPAGTHKSQRFDEDGKEIRPKFLSNPLQFTPPIGCKNICKLGKARQNYSAIAKCDDAKSCVQPVWKENNAVIFLNITLPLPDFKYFSPSEYPVDLGSPIN